MKIKLTIFTPTYNRKNELIHVYKSLLEQTNKEFNWLIIDDGSTDNTESMVNEWIDDNKINITYYKKENGGKHTAYNYAVDKCNTDYMFVALDSDNTMTKDAVEQINNILNENKNCFGIVGPMFIKNGTNYDDIEKYNGLSISEVFCNNDFNIETSLIIKTEYLKKFKYPIFKNEKFFTEAYTYYQMEEPFIWTNKIFGQGNYRNDGLTKNIYKLYVKNPKSFYCFQKMRFYKVKKLKKKIKCLISKNAFYIMSNEKEKLDFVSKITMPIGYVYSQYIKYQYKRHYK